VVPLTLLALTLATPAHAHLMQTGFGPFYDGLTHLFLAPEDLLPVLALSLLAGLRGPRGGRGILFALPAAWLLGAVLGSRLAPLGPAPTLMAAVTLLLGLLAVLDRALPPVAVVGLALGLGLLGGALNGAEFAQAHASGLVAVGIACALFVVVALVSGQVAALRADWTRVAARAAASWIAAIGLLMLGWSLRGG
jgi:hydrogenase/urease accessory protein HupE